MAAFLLLFTHLVGAQGCYNMGFEEGGFDGWGLHSGRIIEEGFDGANLVWDTGLDENQITLISTPSSMDLGCDSLGIELLCIPPGKTRSVRLGDTRVGGRISSLSKSISVTPEFSYFTYQFAVVMQDPGHYHEQQPRFEVRIYDEDENVVECGFYDFRASPDLPDFIHVRDWRVLPWTTAGFDLRPYMGQNLRVEFLTTDCAQGAHLGYAYLTASCGEMELTPVGFCEGQPNAQVQLTAPEGFVGYRWNTGETTRSITVQNPNVGDAYSCEVSFNQECSAVVQSNLEYVERVNVLSSADTQLCPMQPAVLSVPVENFTSIVCNGITYYTNEIPVESTHGEQQLEMQVFGMHGCYEEEVTVSYSTLPTPFVNLASARVCKEDSVTYQIPNVPEINAVIWDDTIAGFSNTYFPVSDEEHSVEIQYGMGCQPVVSGFKILTHPRTQTQTKSNEAVGCVPLEVILSDEAYRIGRVGVRLQGASGDFTFTNDTAFQLTQPGYYDFMITHEDDFGCQFDSLLQGLVHVTRTPVADFQYEVVGENGYQNEVKFSHRPDSEIAEARWYFSHNGAEDEGRVVYKTYAATNLYSHQVKLVVESVGGCVDSITKPITFDLNRLYFPNTITIDDDGINDEFGIEYYNLDEVRSSYSVFNRFGELLFQVPIYYKWNGYFNGEKVKTDVYTVRVEARFRDNTKEVYHGVLNVLK